MIVSVTSRLEIRDLSVAFAPKIIKKVRCYSCQGNLEKERSEMALPDLTPQQRAEALEKARPSSAR